MTPNTYNLRVEYFHVTSLQEFILLLKINSVVLLLLNNENSKLPQPNSTLQDQIYIISLSALMKF